MNDPILNEMHAAIAAQNAAREALRRFILALQKLELDLKLLAPTVKS